MAESRDRQGGPPPSGVAQRVGLRQSLRRELALRYYEYINQLLGGNPIRFLNFGFAEPGPSRLRLAPHEEEDRIFYELYNRVVAGVPLRGRRVLEISCGRGGGAWFVASRFAPAGVLAIDRSPAAIAYCQETYRQARLRFAVGDAEALDLPPQSFDVVLSVEASHVYGSGDRFLAEVHQVLRSGGSLLLADYRPRRRVGAWEDQFRKAGFRLDVKEEISAQVLLSLERSSERRIRLIRKWAPAALVWFFTAFSGARGSRNYRRIQRGEFVYLRYRLRKVRPGR
ncbi:MAG: methyltransferase domain-containing protein [Anaerolineales bacterium]